ncbi:unnamed protein product [Sphagnum tenellum]
MGVPIADQNTELSSSSRRNNAPFLQQSGIRPCINVMAACVDLEDIKPMAAEGTANEKNHLHSGVVPAVHYSHRAPWLRALVLGANDGLVSIASLMLGVEAFHNTARSSGHPSAVSGLAGLVAGACSMAIGEYVSVFSQRDSQLADLEIERQEHTRTPEAELEELAQIYVGRGLTYYLAKQVAEELSRVDALKAHARDELGIDLDDLSNPTQAAVASAIAFAAGGVVPLLSGSFISNFTYRLVSIVLASSVALIAFGATGARLGGANMCKAAVRVSLGGWLAMLITFGVVRIFAFAHLS